MQTHVRISGGIIMVSAAQIQVYKFLAQHEGPPPTVREIADAIGRSVSTTHKTLERLKEKGFITWEPTRCRTIRLVRYEYAV